jgi:uncharacterized protein (TIGR00251 family)
MPDGRARLALRVTPKASADRLQGFVADEDGHSVLKVQVTAVPEDGKANKAVIALLAKTFKLPKSAFELIAGATERRKIMAIDGVREDMLARLQDKGIEV